MKVLILTITAGQGHNSTAKALETCLNSYGIECRVLDAYYYLNKVLGETVSKGYLLSVKAKFAYRTVYTQLEKRSSNSYKPSPMRLTNMAFVHKMKKFIDEYNPDVIICTHIFAGLIVDVMKQLKELIPAKSIGILTDFTVHPYWEEMLRLDYIVTPCEQLSGKVMKKGFESHQILPFGIPISPKFSVEIDKKEARVKLGLDANKNTVLLMSGSMGYGHIESTVKKLDKVGLDIQTIIVCGNNREALQRIEAMKPSLEKPVISMGFTDNVDVLMSASDCIISKPGGLTTSEAMAKRLPLIIVNPIPGQEDRNTEFLLNNGAAMEVTETFPLDEILHCMFDNPDRIALMRSSVDLIRKPDSTRRLCEFIKDIPHN